MNGVVDGNTELTLTTSKWTERNEMKKCNKGLKKYEHEEARHEKIEKKDIKEMVKEKAKAKKHKKSSK